MTTTDRAPRRRWSKDTIRAIAWATGAATFLASVVAIAAVPKPPAASGHSDTDTDGVERPVVERHVLRRIVVIAPPSASAPVTVVQPSTLASAPAPTTPTSGPSTSTGGS